VIAPAKIINLLEDGLDPVVYSGVLDLLNGFLIRIIHLLI
jgi:hypothetical protein